MKTMGRSRSGDRFRAPEPDRGSLRYRLAPPRWWSLPLVFFAVLALGGPVRAASEGTALELRIVKVSGGAEIRSDSTAPWRSARPGQPVEEGSRLRTGGGDTVVLADTGEISANPTSNAGGSAYLELAPRGEMTVRRLRRDVRGASDDAPADTALFHHLRLKAPRGTLRIYLRPRGNLQHDFRLETVNASVGVRGTTFQCRSQKGTTCSVLEGNVRLASRTDTGGSVELTGGYASTIPAQARVPENPKRMSERARRALTRFRSRARRQICSTPIDELMSP